MTLPRPDRTLADEDADEEICDVNSSIRSVESVRQMHISIGELICLIRLVWRLLLLTKYLSLDSSNRLFHVQSPTIRLVLNR